MNIGEKCWNFVDLKLPTSLKTPAVLSYQKMEDRIVWTQPGKRNAAADDVASNRPNRIRFFQIYHPYSVINSFYDRTEHQKSLSKFGTLIFDIPVT